MLTNTRNFNHSYLTSIEEDLTYHGIFWLPEYPENRVGGVLYLRKSGGVSLRLIGMFESDASLDLGLRLVEHPVILGELLPGSGKVTLINCNETERKSPYFYNTSKSTTQRFIADGVLLQAHLEHTDELKFTSFEFSTTYLMDWVNAEIFDLSFKDGREVVSKLPNQVLTIEDGGNKIEITTWGNTANDKSHTTSQHTSITVKPVEPMDIATFESMFMMPLNDLIQLGSSHLNSVRYINVVPVGHTEECKLHINSVFSRIQYSRESYFGLVLFNLSEFTDSYEALVKDWLKLHDKVPHVFKLYFDSMHISNQFPVSKFLNIAQALESFHAEYSGEDTKLRSRLIDLLDQSGDALSEFIQDREEFLNNIMDTRNYYTHYSSNKKIKAAVGFRLEALTHVSRLLLDYHFLLKCNLTHEKAKNIINRGAYGAAIESLVKSNNFWEKKSAS